MKKILPDTFPEIPIPKQEQSFSYWIDLAEEIFNEEDDFQHALRILEGISPINFLSDLPSLIRLNIFKLKAIIRIEDGRELKEISASCQDKVKVLSVSLNDFFAHLPTNKSHIQDVFEYIYFLYQTINEIKSEELFKSFTNLSKFILKLLENSPSLMRFVFEVMVFYFIDDREENIKNLLLTIKKIKDFNDHFLMDVLIESMDYYLKTNRQQLVNLIGVKIIEEITTKYTGIDLPYYLIEWNALRLIALTMDTVVEIDKIVI